MPQCWNPHRIDPIREREFHNSVSDGRAAFRAGVTVNPYQLGTSDHNAWWMGWNEARSWDTAAQARMAIMGAAE